MGIGGYLFKDETGPISEQGIQLAYSYHAKINRKSKLSLGVGILLFDHSISRQKLKFDDVDDDALNNINEKSVSTDVSLGI